MALSHGSGSIVKTGLIIHLDAANPSSYSGSGNTWYDISGNSNHAILNGNANNPIWNSSGYWSFRALESSANNGMQITNSTSLQVSTMTVEIIFTLETKTTGDGDWMCIFNKSSTRGNQNPAISINQGATSNRFLHIELPGAFNSAVNTFTDYTGNKWYHVAATFGTSTTGYLNATQVSTSVSTITLNTHNIHLGYDSSTEVFKGRLAIVRVYNRDLNSSEVVQNFNALKRRFSL
jgi:hypothetical protein